LLSQISLLKKDMDNAILYGEKAIELNPNNAGCYLTMGMVFRNAGRYEEAIKIHKKLMELYPNQKAPLCLTYIATGHLEKAEEILTEIEKKEILPIDAYNLAKIYARMGRKDEAFKWINYEPHAGKLAWAAVGPDFKSLHGDPRWDEFLKRLNLPKK